MVVHLEGGVAATACEADNMVLAVINCDGRLVNGDVVRPHVENNANFALVLQVRETKAEQHCISLWLTDLRLQEVAIKSFQHTANVPLHRVVV